ncbi:hypothetical protein WJX81_001960 [Elliptochloris bilobata]|uniref:ATP-dependent protease subunit HslV n=1 Tax=Elliptochloris bilobata TaxID=381761 RepID=A0AAW1SD01_9CHLO
MQNFRRLTSLLPRAAPHVAGAWQERCGAATVSGCVHSAAGPWQAGQSRSTTVLCVRKGDEVVIMADGQVTKGSEIVKPNVRKVRKIGDGKAIGGFAGATADAFTLFERLEMQLEAHPGQLTRAAVELAKLWRTDKYLRRLDAVMVVADSKQSLTITGNGDVLEPHDGVIAIGSGGGYALAAARALIDLPDHSAMAIAEKAMTIAADVCIYTNHNFTTEALRSEVAKEQPSKLLAGH